MKVALTELQEITKKAILQYGYTEEEAAVIQDVLFYAQLRGNNQGIVKLIGRPAITKDADGEIVIEKETKLSAVLNGHKNHAMVVVSKAGDIAIQKAKEHGVGVVAVNHINTSSGALGYYVKKIAQERLVGFVFAGSFAKVATAGSYEPIFGTNPLAIAVPTKTDPLVFDMATSAMPWYGVIEADTAGRSLPEGIAYDKEGNLTTDPAKALYGALRTFDKGHKGSGLSMMIQVLTGPLVGASFTNIGDVANNWSGHLVIAIDPEMLNGLEAVQEGVTQMIKKVKETKKLPGTDEIFVPSERGDAMTKNILAAGEIEVEDNLFIAIKKLVEK